MKEGDVVKFVRERDYQYIKEMGRGACGRTVLLRDAVLDQHFVCKKYLPLPGLDQRALFDNFVREIKLLHNLNHSNVVRVFNYYLYPESCSGFILMEHVDGHDIETFLHTHPERSNEVFEQTIQGFRHLESRDVLHRDVRPANLLVDVNGVVKIIDFGFGKRVDISGDFDKSISLNWWCEPPAEFATSTYDFSTDVYFVGRLFQKLISDNGIEHFKYMNLLDRMCQKLPSARISSFVDVDVAVKSDLFSEIEFSDQELEIYRDFSGNIVSCIGQLESSVRYTEDTIRILTGLESVFRTVQLEISMPTSVPLLRVFLQGAFTYVSKRHFSVQTLRSFVHMFKRLPPEKQSLVLSNLHTRFDAVERYDQRKPTLDDFDDDIPF
jgi:eukaryotic-like serine/threonine-protein kinase